MNFPLHTKNYIWFISGRLLDTYRLGLKQILQKTPNYAKKAKANFYENTIASVFPCDDIFWIAATEETGKCDPKCPAHVDVPETIDQWVDGGVKEYEEKFDVIQRLL